MLSVQFCLTTAAPLPLRLSPRAGITGDFRCAMSDTLGDAAASINGTFPCFTVIVSRFGVPRPAIHCEGDDGEELDTELPVGWRAGQRGCRFPGMFGYALWRNHSCAFSLSQGCTSAPSPGPNAQDQFNGVIAASLATALSSTISVNKSIEPGSSRAGPVKDLHARS